MIRSAFISAAAVSLLLASTAVAQSATSTPLTATAVIRERTNATQWFAATPSAEQYGHQDSLLRLAIQQTIRHWDYQLELLQSAEIALPSDAVSPIAAQGQLGLGGTYFAANGKNQDPAAASFKTGFLRYHFTHQDRDSTILAGRFEISDGEETSPKNPTLLWLQTNRIGQRLIGNFGFSNGQRSFDGLDAKLNGRNWNITAMAGRPTQGVFNMNANPELNVDIQYLAYTRAFASGHALVRGFALAYHDGRTGLTKTDNRSAAAKAVDHRNIRIGTYGMDVITAIPAGHNTVDLLFWGVLQNGRWGLLDQRSAGFAAEAGLKFNAVKTQPWIRGGMLRTTGDRNPNDSVHNTFFQVLPTPRVYARYPFFNMMNTQDGFVQLVDKPTRKVAVRSDLQFLQLTSSSDLWYQGGGAFDNKVFGYVGRPANGHNSFSSLYDISVDYTVNPHIGLGFYYAHAFGKTVIASIYPRNRDSNYGYFELTYKFSKVLHKSASGS